MSALVGVDLGGTSIRAAVATGAGTHGPAAVHHTPASLGPAAVLDAVAAAVREAAAGATVGGVAIGIPGPLDPATGVVFEAPNLPGWSHVPAARLLEERLGCRVVVHNDARLATYAEWIAGAGRGTRHMLFLTVSTGVGGGMILDGALYAGATGIAGELGHVAVDTEGRRCLQGHPGCLEGVSSGTAIAGRAREALAAGASSSLGQVDPGLLDARAVEEAARDGDRLALGLFEDAGRALGRAIGGFVNIFNPEVLVIGGGLINSGELLFGPLHAAVREIAFADALRPCRIVPAALGTDAGLVGATAWALDHIGSGG